MLKLFVSLLLIIKGITASVDCGNRCSTRDLGIKKFPETNEDLQKICEPYIEYMECEIHKEEICQKYDPRLLQMGYRVLATVREVCSVDTLLHAAVVDNLKCLGELTKENRRDCGRNETQSDRVQQIAEALSEEGLISLAENGNVTNNSYHCLGQMNFFTCHSLVIEMECGTVAMDAYVEIVLKIRPIEMSLGSCEELYHLLPAVIRLRKAEEEKERSVSAFFRRRK